LEKVTVPLGAAVVEGPVTVAVKVTLVPEIILDADEVRVVAVAAGAMVTSTGDDAEPSN